MLRKLSTVRSIGIKKKNQGHLCIPYFHQQCSPMHPNLSFINPSFAIRPCSIPFLRLLAQTGRGERVPLRLLERGKSVKRENRCKSPSYHFSQNIFSTLLLPSFSNGNSSAYFLSILAPS